LASKNHLRQKLLLTFFRPSRSFIFPKSAHFHHKRRLKDASPFWQLQAPVPFCISSLSNSLLSKNGAAPFSRWLAIKVFVFFRGLFSELARFFPNEVFSPFPRKSAEKLFFPFCLGVVDSSPETKFFLAKKGLRFFLGCEDFSLLSLVFGRGFLPPGRQVFRACFYRQNQFLVAK
jgi:hypothetical protein